ncbi:MAG TPA: 50S ribosomal protein L15 [Flavobacteriales bacterium]|nr:50S ribosomal protein L15 [Flavobacteriales bacterium]
MDLSNLKPAKGSIKKNQRLGRGQGSTKGGTAGRGHKGQQSRSGYSRKSGFEGGQQPLQTRVPKFGFKNINRIAYKGINLDTLQALAENKKVKKVDKEVLHENGLVSKNDLVKILGRGELKAKLEITANAFSETAKKAIESAGGTAIELPGRRGKKVNKPRKKTKPRVAAPTANEAAGEKGEEKEESKEEESQEREPEAEKKAGGAKNESTDDKAKDETPVEEKEKEKEKVAGEEKA